MKEIVTTVKDKKELEFLLRALTALGHRIHSCGISVETFLSKHGDRRVIAVSDGHDGIYGKGYGYGGDTMFLDSFLLEAARMKFGPQPIKIKLNDQYEAEVGEKTTKVGCQEFSNEVILKVAEAIKSK